VLFAVVLGFAILRIAAAFLAASPMNILMSDVRLELRLNGDAHLFAHSADGLIDGGMILGNR